LLTERAAEKMELLYDHSPELDFILRNLSDLQAVGLADGSPGESRLTKDDIKEWFEKRSLMSTVFLDKEFNLYSLYEKFTGTTMSPSVRKLMETVAEAGMRLMQTKEEAMTAAAAEPAGMVRRAMQAEAAALPTTIKEKLSAIGCILSLYVNQKSYTLAYQLPWQGGVVAFERLESKPIPDGLHEVMVNTRGFDGLEEDHKERITQTPALWDPDNTKNCTNCAKPFSVVKLRPRHHCRICGRCICDKCSTEMKVFEFIKKTVSADGHHRREKSKTGMEKRVCLKCKKFVNKKFSLILNGTIKQLYLTASQGPEIDPTDPSTLNTYYNSVDLATIKTGNPAGVFHDKEYQIFCYVNDDKHLILCFLPIEWGEGESGKVNFSFVYNITLDRLLYPK